METKQKRKIFRASVTVEAALLMPVVIFTVFMALYLAFHVHNRTWLSSRAGEQAISGHEQELPSLMAGAGITGSLKDTASQRTSSYHTETAYYTGSVLWSEEIFRTYNKTRPLRLLRKARAAVKKN